MREIERAQQIVAALRLDAMQCDRWAKPLPLEEGRQLYVEYAGRPRVTGVTKRSPQKKYYSFFDKFLTFVRQFAPSVAAFSL